jgi:imidazolonepropionase
VTIQVDKIWRNARIATMEEGETPYGAIDVGAIAAADGKIVWVGSEADMPDFQSGEMADLEGRWVTPGLIDCHTHLVYGSNRALEFEQRLNGATYEEISRSGGGIVSTVAATRSCTESELLDQALPRLDHLIAEGVTTVEIKSGYGLDVETEKKILRVAGELSKQRRVRVSRTFLGAHALPAEAGGDKDAYITTVCEEQLPAVVEAGLADSVDAFCDSIGFTYEQTRRVFDAAKSFGLPVRLHAEQLTDQSGAKLAAEFGALSADHLEYLSEASAISMGQAGTVAVLLPGAFYFLRDTKVPPIDLMRKHGVAMAVATDSNPGSSPLTSILLALNMACTLFRMTPEETLAGATRNAARALGIGDDVGTVSAGKVCDLAVWDINSPAELSYAMGFNPLYMRICGGTID